MASLAAWDNVAWEGKISVAEGLEEAEAEEACCTDNCCADNAFGAGVAMSDKKKQIIQVDGTRIKNREGCESLCDVFESLCDLTVTSYSLCDLSVKLHSLCDLSVKLHSLCDLTLKSHSVYKAPPDNVSSIPHSRIDRPYRFVPIYVHL